MTRTAHRIGLAAAILALTAGVAAGTTAAYAESATAVASSTISLSFPGGNRITVGDQATLSGVLSFSDGSPANGLTVHVTRTNPDASQTSLGDATTTSDQGAFAVVDSPPARGNYTYSATFDGDAQRGAATGTSGVLTVDGLTTSLGLRSSATKTAYRHRITLTAHLAQHGPDAAVTFYRKAAGATRALIRTVAVDAYGNAAVTVRPRRNTTFDAAFAGDDVFRAAASSKVKVAVRVRITGALSRFSGTSGAYRLYRYSAACITRGTGCPRYTVSVAPGHAGDKVRLALAVHTRSGWIVAGHTTLKLSARSRAHIVLRYADRSIVGLRLRLQARFAGDAANAGNTSSWSYLRVTG